jgi:excinuclease ABC subunit C
MLSKLIKIKITPKIYKVLPKEPGIYIFRNIKGTPLYIGKSTNISSRVKSYFSLQLSSKTKKMVSEADWLSTIRVNSELEALLLEAKLVRKYQPFFNSQLKDDKNPIYIRITKEKYPQILTARKIERNEKNLAFFGPFPSSTNVTYVLKLIRRIFPYSQHKVGKRGCLYSQIGLCVPCPSVIDDEKDLGIKNDLYKKYIKNISYLRKILSGKLISVRNSLEAKMIKLSKRENFEEALKLRDQIKMLDYITQPVTHISEFLKNPNFLDDIREEERLSLQKLLNNFELPNLNSSLRRVECFDIAHLSGSFPTASMVTFIDGEPDKSLYRHFKIRSTKKADDISSLAEVVRRRKLHFADWGIPDLIIVDGGKGQVSTFWYSLKDHSIPVVGLAKRFETLVIPTFSNGKLSFSEKKVKGPALYFLQRVRNEAHRFARRYHHKLLQASLIPKN